VALFVIAVAHEWQLADQRGQLAPDAGGRWRRSQRQ